MEVASEGELMGENKAVMMEDSLVVATEEEWRVAQEVGDEVASQGGLRGVNRAVTMAENLVEIQEEWRVA